MFIFAVVYVEKSHKDGTHKGSTHKDRVQEPYLHNHNKLCPKSYNSCKA